MDNRVALMAIIVEDRDSVKELNDCMSTEIILSEGWAYHITKET